MADAAKPVLHPFLVRTDRPQSRYRRPSMRHLPLGVGGCACVLSSVLLLSACSDGEASFCTELRRTEGLVADLREAQADDDVGRAAPILDDIGDVLAGLDPPAELDAQLPNAVRFFRYAAESARVVERGGNPPEPSAADDASYDAALRAVTAYAVAECDASPGYLVP